MTDDLTSFARACEQIITQPGFIATADRDRWRVYAMARITDVPGTEDGEAFKGVFGRITGADVEHMLLVAPGMYEALLRGFKSLVTGRGVIWWQTPEEASDPAWPSAVRMAITEIAREQGAEPRAFAKQLDDTDLPRTRARVISLAISHLRKGIR